MTGRQEVLWKLRMAGTEQCSALGLGGITKWETDSSMKSFLTVLQIKLGTSKDGPKQRNPLAIIPLHSKFTLHVTTRTNGNIGVWGLLTFY